MEVRLGKSTGVGIEGDAGDNGVKGTAIQGREEGGGPVDPEGGPPSRGGAACGRKEKCGQKMAVWVQGGLPGRALVRQQRFWQEFQISQQNRWESVGWIV